VVNVHVAGSVTSERDLTEVIQREMIRLGRRMNGGVLGGLA
jgi:hypothetical protein